MCEGLLARVEPPLRSVLEQASEWAVGWGLCRVQPSFARWTLLPYNFLLRSYKIKNFLTQAES